MIDLGASVVNVGRGVKLARDRTRVAAIINVTDDSFSGDGLLSPEAARAKALQAVAEGADVIDIGAESTRPGAVEVSLDEEMRRLIPAVRAVREACPETIVSIDTYKPEVFRAAYEAGGTIVNSVRGATDDLLDVVFDTSSAIVVMHHQSSTTYYPNVVDAVLQSLEAQARRAHRRGIVRERVILDPGIGFGKTPLQNLALLGALDKLTALGYPTMLGMSRKSTLGMLVDRPAEDRDFATAATTTIAAIARVDFVRVHAVAGNRDAAIVADALSRSRRPSTFS